MLITKSKTGYFYMVALLLSGSSVFVPVFQKVQNLASKKTECGFYYLLAAIAFDAMNEPKSKYEDLMGEIMFNILKEKIDYESMLGILICYLINERLDGNLSFKVYNIVKKMIDCDYLQLGYEVAFVAKTWYNEKRFNDLYNDLSRKLNSQPGAYYKDY